MVKQVSEQSQGHNISSWGWGLAGQEWKSWGNRDSTSTTVYADCSNLPRKSPDFLGPVAAIALFLFWIAEEEHLLTFA